MNSYTGINLPQNFSLICENGKTYIADRCNLDELANPIVIVCWVNSETDAINATIYSLAFTLKEINSGLWKIGEVYEN